MCAARRDCDYARWDVRPDRRASAGDSSIVQLTGGIPAPGPDGAIAFHCHRVSAPGARAQRHEARQTADPHRRTATGGRPVTQLTESIVAPCPGSTITL